MAEVIVVTVDIEQRSQGSNAMGHVIEIASDMKWSDFDLVLRVAFGLESALVKYVDEDNDIVTICSDEELKEAFRVAKKQNNLLNVKLCDTKPGLVTCPVAPPSVAAIKTQPSGQSGGQGVGSEAGGEVVSVAYSDLSSDDSVIMEVAESNKDTSSSPDSPPGRCFRLRHLSSNRVLDIEGWSREAGTRIILYRAKHGQGGESPDNQLFMEDEETATIRSYFCGLCLDATEKGLTIQPFSPGKLSQRWTIVGDRLQNADRCDLVIGCPEGTPVVMPYQGTDTQQWAVEYYDSRLDEEIHILMSTPKRLMSETSEHKQNLYAELARQMSRHLSHPEEAGRGDEARGGDDAPKWFTDYMEQFKKDLCEEISNLVTRKTVRRILTGLMDGGTNPATPTSTHSGLDQDHHQRLVHHFGVVCDSCELPINGVRYKCGNCEDFDLCGPCEVKVTDSGCHDSDHVFIKIRRPAMAFPRKKTGRPAPLLKRSLYPTDEEIQRIQEKMLRKQEKHRRRGEKHDEKMKRREDKLKRRHEFLREIPSKKEKLEFPLHTVPFEKFDASFVRDENYPDGCAVLPDVRITKRWVMCNTGSHAWTSNTKLSMMWGNIPAVREDVEVPHLQLKEEGVIAVEFTTPAYPGVYQSHWRMSHKNFKFGHRVWCSIVVVLPEDQEALATKPALMCEPNNEQDKKAEQSDKDGGQREEVVTATLADDDIIIDVETMEDSKVKGEKEGVQEKKCSMETDILSAQDILSFEMLDIRDRNTPKVSQTATPTNTPMAMTPPKSPVREMEEGGFRLSTSSSVEIVSESSEESTSHMTELVQERIAKLGLKPDHLDDIETISTCSEDSDSDSDFYIVPLPDCFNPNLPLSTSTSTSVVVSREEVQKTVDDILMASKNLGAPALIPETVDLTRDEAETIDLTRDEAETVDLTRDEDEDKETSLVHVDHHDTNDNTSDDVSLLAFETSMTEVPPVEVTEEMTPTPEAQAVALETVPATMATPALHPPPEVTTDENANSVPSTPEATSAMVLNLTMEQGQTGEGQGQPGEGQTQPGEGQTQPGEGENVGPALEDAMKESGGEAVNGSTKEQNENEAETDLKSVASDKQSEDKATRPLGIDIAPRPAASSSSSSPHTPPSPSVLASSLMTAAIGVATQAAATAYTTAKDVFHTLQASKEYVPPKSNWKPPQSKWTPPKQDFTMPKETWTPPKQDWTPPPTQSPATPPTSTPTPSCEMDQLVEMGFADRELNTSLLKKHDNDVQKVVQELVSRQDNQWYQNRH